MPQAIWKGVVPEPEEEEEREGPEVIEIMNLLTRSLEENSRLQGSQAGEVEAARKKRRSNGSGPDPVLTA